MKENMIDYTNKCGSCEWLDTTDKTSIGYRCTNPILSEYKVRKEGATAYRKYKFKKACKKYEMAGKNK